MEVTMTRKSVAFIGLGAMGWHMAGHLTKVYTDVRVWNRTASKAKEHARVFATQATSLKEAGQADIIFSCLPTSKQVEEIIQQAQPKTGSIWVDCTSGEPQSAQRLQQQLKEQGVTYLDAPVSGQTIGAEKGTLTVMVGGDPNMLEQANPAIQTFAGLIQHVGESGSGFAVKAVNNILMAANLWVLAEGMCNLKSQGVELDAALKCINASSGQSNMSHHIFAQRVLSREFPLTFALNLLAKDATIATQLAGTTQTIMPVLQLTQQLYRSASNNLPSESDFSSVVQQLEQWNNLTLQSA